MAVPKNKQELIFKIENNYSRLKKDLETIPWELAREKGIVDNLSLIMPLGAMKN